MQCDNHFCIYWCHGNCLLDDISIDIQGSCQDCIYVSITEDFLELEREKIRSRYEKEDWQLDENDLSEG